MPIPNLRKPKYLSHSSLSLWEKDREEFFIRHLAPTKAPKLPQENFMSIGSAFDAYAKSSLHEAIFGAGADPQFGFEAIFEEQVEPHNRDWAREHGKYVFDSYVHTGAYAELLATLLRSREAPRFEFTVTDVVGERVPVTGKPDCRFVHECGVHVILDWKVKGYCSKYGASPSKNYALCRDGYDAIALGIGKTKKNPEGRQSSSHGKQHKNYVPHNHRGLTIHGGYMEDSNAEHADQLALYGWLLGEVPGDESVVLCIDEIVSKYMGEGQKPLLRVANHRARVRRDYQLKLLDRAVQCWDAIETGHIFTDLSRADSDERCEILSGMSVGLASDGTSRENFFNEIVRPPFRK
ncbi:MAG: hypothetical protein DWQ31_16800 [Planctomycetota bacterium]|nr:MAG: hypothetical protein DWQ31_16800 [Planctomycetota bacterium]REJ92013.1 MAG: hypothetical protein DWQ35_12750 [Planctomycetota bacterium]REK28549.1 MAG: hypothetical protein DWQ42_04340 [Planctomycetota bacterium]REK39164.1 MAG: hypothetical protein DWQ46_17925 [Planctomycetota bacterium]